MKKRKEDIRVVKRTWSHKLLVFSGFTLALFFLLNLSLEGVIISFSYADEIALVLLTILTISFISERALKMKKGKIYEKFYSVYLALALVILTTFYWITYLNDVDIGVFRLYIVFTHILVFAYSLITIDHAEKLWFIVTSYIFVAIITVVLFAFIYWILSIFGVGFLQFNECNILNPSLDSDNWFYFSSVTFYSLGYGDICPLEYSRFFSQLEVAAGALINTILIGFIFWKIREAQIEEDACEKK